MCRVLLLAQALAMLAAGPALAFENGVHLQTESGAVWQSRNDVQVPTTATTAMPQGSRFSLKQLQGAGPNAFLRVSGGYTWGARHQVHVLYAPLAITASGNFSAPVSFQGVTFGAGVPTAATYRFDSYRIGYRYKILESADWQLWGGLTVKIRDADIALRQGVLRANRANTGPVPLLSLYAKRELGSRWSAIFDVEGLAAPQGRALDAAVKLRREFPNGIGLSAGYRMLEGGADNAKVYAFAWLHYGVIGLDYRF